MCEYRLHAWIANCSPNCVSHDNMDCHTMRYQQSELAAEVIISGPGRMQRSEIGHFTEGCSRGPLMRNFTTMRQEKRLDYAV